MVSLIITELTKSSATVWKYYVNYFILINICQNIMSKCGTTWLYTYTGDIFAIIILLNLTFFLLYNNMISVCIIL